MKKLVRLWKRPCQNGTEFKYVLIWYDEQGKERWQRLGHTDARKAERQRTQKERELRMGIVEPGSMKLSEFMNNFIRDMQGQVVETTMSETKHDMKEFISEIGDLLVESTEFKHAEKYLRGCLAKGNRPATVNKKIRHLHRVFELAKKRGILERNPFHDITTLRVTDRAIKTFRDNEVDRLVQSTPNILWKARILIARCAGLRIGEILNLTWQDINFEEAIVTVQPKENTTNTWAWHPKDYEIRELPLSEEA